MSDARTERSRARLRQAFIALFVERSYDEISIADVAKRAGVGRSTLYEHYRGKDSLLLDTVRYPFQGLAAAIDGTQGRAALLATLMHFWDNRAKAAMLRRESSRRALARVLAGLIEARLAARDGAAPAQRAAAAFAAEVALGTVMAWTAGDLPLTAVQLADALAALMPQACIAPAGGEPV